MSEQHIGTNRPKQYCVAVSLLLAVGPVPACYKSTGAADTPSADSGIDSIIPVEGIGFGTSPGSNHPTGEPTGGAGSATGYPNENKEPTGEAGSGTNHSIQGEEPTRGTDAADSSNKEPIIDEGKPPGPQTADEWKDIVPSGEIEAADAEQIPIGLWIGEAQVRTELLGGCFERFFEPYRVVLEIVPGQEPGSTFGLVIFGEGDPLPPVTDPDKGYPPEDTLIGEDIQCRYYIPREGFAYTIRQGSVREDGFFQFRIAVQELYEPWCALQTSYQDSRKPTGYSCMPPMSADEDTACGNMGAFYFPSGEVECPIDRGKYELCGGSSPCVCTQDGCIANMNRTIRFDLMIKANELEGVITNLEFDPGMPPIEVRLRKVR